MTRSAGWVPGMLAAVTIASACGPRACADRAPRFCQPVKEAFQLLFEAEANFPAFARAARAAARNLREAEKSAPPDLAEALRAVAHFYEKSAEEGEVELGDVQRVRPHAGKLGEAVKAQCGFTLDELVTRSPERSRGVPGGR